MGSIRNKRGGHLNAPPQVYLPFLDPSQGDSEWENEIAESGQVLLIMFIVALILGLLLIFVEEVLGISLPKPD